MPTIGMCLRPAIRSTSGLTTRATALIRRRARGPKRMTFLAARGCAAGPGDGADVFPVSAAGTAVSRRGSAWSDMVAPPGANGLSGVATSKDEDAGGKVTGPGPAVSMSAQSYNRGPLDPSAQLIRCHALGGRGQDSRRWPKTKYETGTTPAE